MRTDGHNSSSQRSNVIGGGEGKVTEPGRGTRSRKAPPAAPLPTVQAQARALGDPTRPAPAPFITVNLAGIDVGGADGAVWSLPHDGDLDANLVKLGPGGRIDEHRNDEVDVVYLTVHQARKGLHVRPKRGPGAH